MKLASILNPELVFFNIKGKDRETVYLELLEKMKQVISLPVPHEELADAAIRREDSILVSYEKGFCFPHVRRPDFGDLHTGIGILDEPLRLKENDAAPVSIVFFFLIAPETSDLYLTALSAITRFLMDDSHLSGLTGADTPEEFIGYLAEMNVQMRKDLTAQDVMETDFLSIKQDESLGRALDILTRHNRRRLPVLDSEGRLAGVIDARDIIRKNIPEYLMMMENTGFLTSFEPFDQVFDKEDKSTVKDYMSQAQALVGMDTPLIQLTLKLVKDDIPALFVVDQERLEGVITIKELIRNVLRG